MTEWSTSKTLRVLDIKEGTIVDGPGLRTSIYFAGCSHHCPGCHNPESWDPDTGQLVSVAELMDVITDNGFDVTFSGGDPLMQIDAILPLAESIKNSGLGLWVYTGYTYSLIEQSQSLSRILKFADAVVEGRFELNLRDTSLHFRGSSNQRIISHGHDITDRFDREDATCIFR
ncbi:MAG: anaerobic ribonucleoside-triphosphate reductase activating protein [Candidatus Amulumruptor caecigallinarius]|nr:anaerobic ribonucleoside-triphosphate reductase activating protein [Candidatus Amulumruptor caecigallinarius]MCM1397269.1 anaerobic ribonucleoside-triphosphate reductase activating protein [Candidatus Amulumruptor caecigallinarius]MCM1453666.1 anaerobic ribonucleoside-triphosphate reductase activating protein [bacterium]